MSRKILFFTKGEAQNPASRYRFLQFLPALEAAGFETLVRPLFPNRYYRLGNIESKQKRLIEKSAISAKAFIQRVKEIPLASSADLVVVENQLFPYEQGLLECYLKAINERFVIEFDDAIFLTAGHERKLAKTLGSAKHAIVGNSYLARFAERYQKNLSIVPTVVDASRYPPKRYEAKEKDAPIRIGWIGMQSTMPFLVELKGALESVQRNHPIELVVISSVAPDLGENVPVRFIPWSEENEAKTLTRLDIGIMPLPNTNWARGKCGLKLLQYMAAGLISVASPVGVNSEILTDGETGFLASSPKEWAEALEAAILMPVTKKRAMSRKARERLKRDYSLDAWSPKLVRLYENLIED